MRLNDEKKQWLAELQSGDIKTRISAMTRREISLCVNIISKVMFAGMMKNELISYVCETFNVSEDCAQQLMDMTFELVKEDVANDLANEVTLALGKRADLYRRAYETGDYKLCLEIIKDRDKMRGLYGFNKPERTKLEELIEAMKEVAHEDIIDGELIEEDEDED